MIVQADLKHHSYESVQKISIFSSSDLLLHFFRFGVTISITRLWSHWLYWQNGTSCTSSVQYIRTILPWGQGVWWSFTLRIPAGRFKRLYISFAEPSPLWNSTANPWLLTRETKANYNSIILLVINVIDLQNNPEIYCLAYTVKEMTVLLKIMITEDSHHHSSEINILFYAANWFVILASGGYPWPKTSHVWKGQKLSD